MWMRKDWCWRHRIMFQEARLNFRIWFGFFEDKLLQEHFLFLLRLLVPWKWSPSCF
jgi:hypothetical protein